MYPPRLSSSLLFILSIVFLQYAALAFSPLQQEQQVVVVVVKCETEACITSLKQSSNVEWWIELGDMLMIRASGGVRETEGMSIIREVLFDEDWSMYIVQRHKDGAPALSTLVPSLTQRQHQHMMMSGWGFYVIYVPKRLTSSTINVLSNEERWSVREFDHTSVTLVSLQRGSRKQVIMKNNRADPIASLVSQVDGDRWFADVKTLQTYNRYTLGSTISQAQDWIISQLKLIQQSHPNIAITTQSFPVRSVIAYNIVVTITGSKTPDNWVIVGGHYDSTSQSPSTTAPGAEDNGSGAAAVLEMIRVFATQPPPNTARFIFFSGEEQGLFGSKYDSSNIVSSGQKYKVRLMHNMDMIAYRAAKNTKYQVLLETTSAYTNLFPMYENAARNFTTLDILKSTNAWGSDHEPYLNNGMPALLTIDGDWESYPDYHRTTDTIDKCNKELGEMIIRMGVGAIATALGY